MKQDGAVVQMDRDKGSHSSTSTEQRCNTEQDPKHYFHTNKSCWGCPFLRGREWSGPGSQTAALRLQRCDRKESIRLQRCNRKESLCLQRCDRKESLRLQKCDRKELQVQCPHCIENCWQQLMLSEPTLLQPVCLCFMYKRVSVFVTGRTFQFSSCLDITIMAGWA